MTLVQDLELYQSKRRFPTWEPVPAGVDKKQKPETLNERLAVEIVHRCLDFVTLELIVGDWVTQESEIPEEAKPFLERNAKDEEKHDRALRYLMNYYDYQQMPIQGARVCREWQYMLGNKLKNAYALEMGVFFTVLPALTKYGDVYAASVAQWINDDERTHVETNLRIMRELGWKLEKQHAVAVGRTVRYIYGVLGETEATKQAERAVKRLLTARDGTMAEESVPVTIAFFEQQTRASIVY